MFDKIYQIGRWLMARGWVIGLILIGVTIGLGTWGFLATTGDNDVRLSFSDALYNAISLLAIQTGARPTAGNKPLEWARWFGMMFWASAVLTLVIRLFRESVHRWLVKTLAKDHVIVAGLGEHGGRLVKALRDRGRTVIILESDRDHPAVDQCRRLGAVLLFGEPDDPQTLLAASLTRASAILALFRDETDCVRTATAAYRVLHAEKTDPRMPPVRCVLRLTEPGLLDVVRRHKIKTDPTDRIHLEILNSHEIAATTMVREAAVHSTVGAIRKAMVLGLGTHHRLGEMVALRLAKDHFLNHAPRGVAKLEIHVFDEQAEAWLDNFRGRYPFVDQGCSIQAHPCWSSKVGASGFDRDYDAAFLCIPDEGHATAQAVMLRREVLTDGQPIMVRVRHSRSGYGELIGETASGWGENIHAIGLEDSLFDPDTATQPEMELRAQTIHHEYRLQKRREALRASTPEARDLIWTLQPNRPWPDLDESNRNQNRELAEKYDEYLNLIHGRKQSRYRREFAPGRFGQVPAPSLFELPAEELDALAEVEHSRWLRLQHLQGWTHGEIRDDIALRSPFIREFADLTDDQKDYNRDFVREIPRILAMADYAIVVDHPSA